jgi:hypothetical protein
MGPTSTITKKRSSDMNRGAESNEERRKERKTAITRLKRRRERTMTITRESQHDQRRTS